MPLRRRRRSPLPRTPAYYRCPENGVVLEERDGGPPRTRKDENEAGLRSIAQAKCANLLPGGTLAPADFVAEAEKLSSCVRGNGFPEHPDLDPKTGNVEPVGDEEAKYKSAGFRTATGECSADADSDIVGG
ncbi:hypothetical protein [Streptomyces sp. CB02400]|uniref:hypothetical protein n=1 Tax=Streptomyces sp. CB02400 TaxID=1703944 RepID=UPI0011613DAE|nr:hypothetical protein [Streptomyces sp. CB02400]